MFQTEVDIIAIDERYADPEDIPESIPVFPLQGAILLPRVTMPLHIFEPRYLMMIDDVLAGDRVVGIIQPTEDPGQDESPKSNSAKVRDIGCVGRLTSFTETEDDRVLISLTGISRFVIDHEEVTETPYRMFNVNYKPFALDLKHNDSEDGVDREHLLDVLKEYLDSNELSADWDSIHRSSNELLVNTLSMISPYGAEEKQALLEAADLKTRAEVLIALAEMELASRDDGSGNTLQ